VAVRLLSANLSGYPTRPGLKAIEEYIRVGGENPFTTGVKNAVQDQMNAGVDIITDGQVRETALVIASTVPGMVTDNSIHIENKLGTPRKPTAAEDFSIAVRECGDVQRVKAILPGPISFAKSCQVNPKSTYNSSLDVNLLFDIASILRYEINALKDRNASLIQIIEEIDRINDLEVFLELLSVLFKRVETPICHLVGDVSESFLTLLEGALTVISFDLVAFPQNCSVTRFGEDFASHEKRVSIGCVNASTARQEPTSLIDKRANAFVDAFGYEAVWISPSETLAGLPRSSAFRKLTQLEAIKQRVASRMS